MKLYIYEAQSVHKSKISSDVIRNIWEPKQEAYITNTLKMDKARQILMRMKMADKNKR